MQKGAVAGRQRSFVPHDPRGAPVVAQAWAAVAQDRGGTVFEASGAQPPPAGVGEPISRVAQLPVGTHPAREIGVGVDAPQGNMQFESVKKVTVGGAQPSPCGAEQLQPHWAGPASSPACPSKAGAASPDGLQAGRLAVSPAERSK